MVKNVKLYGEVFDLKRIGVLFASFWGALFILSFFTGSDGLSLFKRFLFTGVFALFALLLFGVEKRGKSNTSNLKKRTYSQDMDVHIPLDPKVLYRVRQGKIYKGTDVAPIYELRENKIYPVFSAKPAYEIKSGKVYRCFEPAPLLEIKGNLVYRNLSNKVVYELSAPRKNVRGMCL